ncbi:hypothetical protein F5Y19DRAFT_132158 [Xylariaceae sp. FL1651]|nr:hypothetical protein F5Y19DRAFT_132158 [Xylariaceae sp. FL1651]
MPSIRREKPIFKDCVVAIAGELGHEHWKEDKVKGWVSVWGGTFSSTVDASVTHLLCTQDNFKQKTAPVKAALQNRDTKIVTRDWLEDSINKKKCLKTKEYQLDKQVRHENSEKRKFQKNVKESELAEYYVDSRFYNIYRDSTYFEYELVLTRNDEKSGNIGQKYIVALWESVAKPHLYHCTAKYFNKPRGKPVYWRPFEAPVVFEKGFGAFKKFFQQKTGISWDERITKVGTTGPDRFQYQPPSGGKPIGLVKGRPVSAFGDGDRGSSIGPNENRKHKGGLEESRTSHKRLRDQRATGDAVVDNKGEGPAAKKPRRQQEEPVSLLVEANTRKEPIVINSDSEHEEAKAQHRKNCTATPNDETMLDAGGVEEAKPELNDVIDNGVLQAADDFEEVYVGSSDEIMDDGTLQMAEDIYDAPAVPCNSEASEEDGDTSAKVGNDTQADNDTMITNRVKNNYDEEISSGAEVEEDAEVSDVPEARDPRAGERGRAAARIAANILYETLRGVRVFCDSQAALIDSVRGRMAREHAAAVEMDRREKMLDAEDEAATDSDDSEH